MKNEIGDIFTKSSRFLELLELICGPEPAIQAIQKVGFELISPALPRQRASSVANVHSTPNPGKRKLPALNQIDITKVGSSFGMYALNQIKEEDHKPVSPRSIPGRRGTNKVTLDQLSEL